MTVGAIWGQRRFLRFLPSGKPNFLRYFSPSSGLIGVYWRETPCNLVSLCLPRLVMIFIKHSTYSASSPGFLVTIGEHTSSHFCCSGLGHCNLVGRNICCGRGVGMAKLIGGGDNIHTICNHCGSGGMLECVRMDVRKVVLFAEVIQPVSDTVRIH